MTEREAEELQPPRIEEYEDSPDEIDWESYYEDCEDYELLKWGMI